MRRRKPLALPVASQTLDLKSSIPLDAAHNCLGTPAAGNAVNLTGKCSETYNERFTVTHCFDLMNYADCFAVAHCNVGPAATRWAALFYGAHFGFARMG